jgi:hypothetical protein
MKPGITLSKITSDPKVTGRLWMQICDFKNAIQIEELQMQELLANVLEVMKKLESVNYHRTNLERVVAEQLEARRKRQDLTSDRSTGAEKEFEAFLLQGKATLDVLVKVLFPLCNIKFPTYGDGGKRVLKALSNNLPKSDLARADWLLKMIEVSTPWIEQWVGSYRDTVAHYRSIDSTGFVSIANESGQFLHAAPKDKNGLLLHELANNLFADLLIFCEDFLVCAYRIKIFKGFEIGYADEKLQVETHQSKYCLYMVDYTEASP